ncbi:transposase [Streptomyces sp. NPDC002809]|uniref:transposase n=1 Tax=Streptomyces sp. NPDC002809 TaxID=3154433 RepID=UPI00331BA6B3
MTTTKAVRVSLLADAVQREAFTEASRFRGDFYEYMTARRDELFGLADAVLCADGAVKSPVDLTLSPEHRRGHGAMHGGLNHGRTDMGRLRTVLAGLSLPRFDGGRLVLSADVSPWLRPDAPCSAERLFCHVYGRAKSASQFIPGRPYSFVARAGAGCHVLDRDPARTGGRRNRRHRQPTACSQTPGLRSRTATQRQEQTAGTPLRRRQDRQTPRDPHAIGKPGRSR